MNKLNVFRTPQEFLDASLEYLEKKEIENNLILGLTDAIEDKSKKYSGFNFLSVTNNEKPKLFLLRTVRVLSLREIRKVPRLSDLSLIFILSIT